MLLMQRSNAMLVLLSLALVGAFATGCTPEEVRKALSQLPPPPAGFTMTGQLASGSTAAATPAGNVTFQLINGFGVTYDVEVDSHATMTRVEPSGAIIDMSAADVVTVLNGGGSYDIEAGGNSAPAGTTFVADVSLTISDNSGTPGTGMGMYGTVSASGAVLNAAGDIEFEMVGMGMVRGMTQPMPAVLTSVTVDVSSAMMTFDDQSGGIQILDAAGALALLNTSPSYEIWVESSTAIGMDIVADVALEIFDTSFTGWGSMVYGTVASGTSASVNASGEVEFQLDDGWGSAYSVTVTTGAAMEYYDANFNYQSLDAAGAVALLNITPSYEVWVESSSTFTGMDFVADLYLEIYESSLIFPNANYIAGEVVGASAAVTSTGEIEFQLSDIVPPGLGMPNTLYDVVVTVNAVMEFVDSNTGTVQTLDAAGAVALLNTVPSYLIELEGSAPATGTSFVADVYLGIYDMSGVVAANDYIYGDGVSGSASVAGNGDLTFELDISGMAWAMMFPAPAWAGQTSVTIVVPASAAIVLDASHLGGSVQYLTASEATAEINGGAYTWADADGSYDAASNTFTVDLELWIGH